MADLEKQSPEIGEFIAPDEAAGPTLGTEFDKTARFVNKLIKEAREGVRSWQTEARHADRFLMSKIWAKADEAKLKEENRPVPEINFTKKYIDGVEGMMIMQDITIDFLPRVADALEATTLSLLATGVYDTVVQNSRAQFERANAFKDCIVRGIGWMGQRLDTSQEPGGEIMLERVDGYEIVWDTAAREQNLEDGRFIVRIKMVPKHVAKTMWPDEEKYIDGAAHDGTVSAIDEPLEIEHPDPMKYDPLNALDKAARPGPRNWISIKEAYWYEDETWWEFIDPFTHKRERMSDEDFRKFKKEFKKDYPKIDVVAVDKAKRVYKRAFVIKEKTMEESDAPLQTAFPYKAITGDFDADSKIWRGLLHSLMEPARYAAKFFSQALFILATNPKGGVFYEPDAFENIKEAMAEWGRADPFIRVKAGAIANKKIEIRQPTPLPQGMFEMWQACVAMIQEVTGINIDMLGQSTGEVPGVTTRQRVMGGIATVAHFFSAYRRYLVFEAPSVMEYIKQFYTDQRLIRIGGPFQGQQQVVQVLKNQLEVKWDFVIEESPRSPDQRQQYWDNLAPVLPYFAKSGALFMIPSLFDYAPWPPRVIAETKQYLEQGRQMMMQQSQQGDPKKQKEQGGSKDPQLTQANIQKRQAETQKILIQAKAIDQESALRRAEAALATIGKQQELRGQSLEMRQGAQRHQMDMMEAGQRMRRENQAHNVDQWDQMTRGMREAMEPRVQ